MSLKVGTSHHPIISQGPTYIRKGKWGRYEITFLVGDKVKVKVYEDSIKIAKGEIRRKSLPPVSFDTLIREADSKIKELLDKHLDIKNEIVIHHSAFGELYRDFWIENYGEDTLPKVKKSRVEEPADSDEECFPFSFKGKPVVLFKLKGLPIKPSETIIPCFDQNIKGGKLLKMAHAAVKEAYGGSIDSVFDSLKDRDFDSYPKLGEGVFFITMPYDWFLSLGGWKGMIPKKEVKGYFFNRFIPEIDEIKDFELKKKKIESEKFRGIQVYDCPYVFSLKNNRLHLPKEFLISGIDVTRIWKKNDEGKYVNIPSSTKSDLTYGKIVKVFSLIKEIFRVQDDQLAELQLRLLNMKVPKRNYSKRENEFWEKKNKESLPDWFLEFSSEDQVAIKTFLYFVNALMLGMESTGLNAGILTSLMTLELISEKHLTYKNAFDANVDGGAYPFACLGNNSGTYSNREMLLEDKNHSMKTYRKQSHLSPVALKEVLIIKKWLELCRRVYCTNFYEEQKTAIRQHFKQLIYKYFSPRVYDPRY